MVSADSVLSEWNVVKLKDEILEFLYRRILSYEDICLNLRARMLRPTEYRRERVSEELLQEYRAKTMKQSKDVADRLLGEMLREGVVKENHCGYDITESGKYYLLFWKEHEDDWLELMSKQYDEEDPKFGEEDYNEVVYESYGWDDTRDWEKDKEDPKLMEKLFDI